MIGLPQSSPWDLNFRLFGIPIRVSPMFWVLTAVLGWGDGDFQRVAIWIGCVFVSIIVHEMGHALTNRMFGRNPAIVLHGMGGLCFSEGPNISPWKRVLVLFNGPLAGFLLFGIVIAVSNLIELRDPNYQEIALNLRFINLYWGYFNLLPIWPLDGGQITGVVLQRFSERRGQELTHGISLVFAGIIAVWYYQQNGSLFMLLLMGMFAMNNFQMLQLLNQRHWRDTDDEEEWWRR